MLKAMLLAAGRGERMRPLTDGIAKPLLRAGQYRLIEYHLYALAASGIRDIVINLAYKSEQIRTALGNGERYGVHLIYSDESTQALETAGGIIHALPLLGEEPFLVINADIWTDFPFQQLALPAGKWAKLIMVDNPPHHTQGDFYLHDGMLRTQGSNKLTFSGIGIYSPELFKSYAPGHRRLADVLQQAIAMHKIAAQHYRGDWSDIGHPGRLDALREKLATGGQI